MVIVNAGHAGDVVLLGLQMGAGTQSQGYTLEKRDKAHLRGWTLRDRYEAKGYNRYKLQLSTRVKPGADIETTLPLRAIHTFINQVQHAFA